MAKILHVVNYFDPAADVVRCVRELRNFSRHEHDLIVSQIHPLQHIYQYELAEHGFWNTGADDIMAMLDWADALLFHFVGSERGIDNPRKPAGFRNLNIYWDSNADRFWSAPDYNAGPLGRYKLVSSSHVGAKDFLPADRFRWLPDLLPIDGQYSPDLKERFPCVSFIKHHEVFAQADFGIATRQDLHNTAHSEVLRRRRSSATVAIDNLCDGHWGLAGQEAVLMGLPTIVFNHPKTKEALAELGPSPFVEIEQNLESAVLSALSFSVAGSSSRAAALQCFDPKKLVERYWDAFFEELLA